MKKKEKQVPSRMVLTNAEKDAMIAVLARNPEVFELFKDSLKVDQFGDFDTVYKLIWQLVQDHHAEFGTLPSHSILMTSLVATIENCSDLLMEGEQANAEALVEMIFDDEGTWKTDLSTSEEHAEWAIKAVKQFREEQVVTKVKDQIRRQGLMVSDVPQYLDAARQEADEIAAIGVSTAGSLFPEGWDKDGGINTVSTGLVFIDTFLNGGHAPEEVYGVLGPFASCKTTLGVMLAVNACRQAAQILKETGEHQYVFLASYEAGLSELRIRTLSYAAKIQRESLEAMGKKGLAALSTSDNLQPYEEKMFAGALADGKKVLGEQGRAKLVMKWLENHLIVLDMTGADESHRGAGSGYIPEIAHRIKTELRARGADAQCRLVVIDYVGAMAKRHLAKAEKEVAELRHWITSAPLEAKNQIAIKFQCPVWLMQQISGAANDKTPGARYYHTDAAESKSFAENLDFCFSVGKPNGIGLCQIVATKHRRTGEQPAQIIQIKGEMSTVVSAGSKYVLDPHSRTFVEKGLHEGVTSVSSLLASKYAPDIALDVE